MNAKQLKRLLKSAGLTQSGAALQLSIHDRTMRRYISGYLQISRVGEIASSRLTTSVVGIDELTEWELVSFSEAVDIARGVRGAGGFIHSEPVRDANNRFCELRVYNGDSPPELLAMVPIGEDGHPMPAELA